MQFISNLPRQLLWLLAFDILLILIHLFLSWQYTFFHIDHEQNFPTYYQSFKLIIGALLGIYFYKKSIKKIPKLLFLILIAISFWVGIDELLQIHENIYLIFEGHETLSAENVVNQSLTLGFDSSLWILYYAPFMIVVIGCLFFWIIKMDRQLKSVATALSVILILVVIVFATEILGSSGRFFNDYYQLLIVIEEGSELLAGSLLFYLLTNKN